MIFAEAFMSYSVFVANGGEYLLRAERGPCQGQDIYLVSFSKKYITSEIRLRLGPSRSESTFGMAIFRWPRGGGAKAFLSLMSIYERLGFAQYSGRPWRWVHVGRPHRALGVVLASGQGQG